MPFIILNAILILIYTILIINNNNLKQIWNLMFNEFVKQNEERKFKHEVDNIKGISRYLIFNSIQYMSYVSHVMIALANDALILLYALLKTPKLRNT